MISQEKYPLAKLKMLSKAWVFVDLIVEGRKIMVDVLESMSTYIELEKEVIDKTLNDLYGEQNDENSTSPTSEALVDLRTQISKKCI